MTISSSLVHVRSSCNCFPVRESKYRSSLRVRRNFGVTKGLDVLVFRNVEGGVRRGIDLRVKCEAGRIAEVLVWDAIGKGSQGGVVEQLTLVMKFGGSSLASAERMREVANLIRSSSNERPVIVLSAMGKTTNKLLLAGENAVTCGVTNVSDIEELSFVKELHLRQVLLATVEELRIDKCVISRHLDNLEQPVKGVVMMKELTQRTKAYLVSFGECMSTTIFAAYLNRTGTKACQHVFSSENTWNEATYPAVAKRLNHDWQTDPAIPVVTGFLGKGSKSCAVTTLGRGGSDLTATTIGKALGLREVQVWKGVDGVLTCDPHICSSAQPVPYLTFEEAAELAYFGAQVLHPQSMRPAKDSGVPVRNPNAPGTLINQERDMTKAILTSIVVKRHVTMLDIVSTRLLGSYGFLAKISIGCYAFIPTVYFYEGIFNISRLVNMIATSEVSISLTLDTAKLWSRELIQQELDQLSKKLEEVAVVNLVQNRAIISLIGNVQKTSLILEKVFCIFRSNGINVQMISQSASKVN
ncbi:Aspartokinase 2, chloroplastic-like protein [Drosera capensis]